MFSGDRVSVLETDGQTVTQQGEHQACPLTGHWRTAKTATFKLNGKFINILPYDF